MGVYNIPKLSLYTVCTFVHLQMYISLYIQSKLAKLEIEATSPLHTHATHIPWPD